MPIPNPMNCSLRYRGVSRLLMLLAKAAFCFALVGSFTLLDAQIKDVYADKARFLPGSEAKISVDLGNDGSSSLTGVLVVRVTRLAATVARFTRQVTLDGGQARTETFRWVTRNESYRGYGLDVDFLVGGQVVSSRSSAIDVSPDSVRFPRYGYYTDFHPDQSQERLNWEVDNLSKYHINIVQYYDWMWTHDRLIPYENGSPVEEYNDFFGVRKKLGNIRSKIQRGHDRGIDAMAYSLLYGDSGSTSGPEHIEWASFTGPGKTQPADVRNHIGKIWVMDVSNEDWQSHIFGQFKNAMSELGFDGIHLDNLGGAWSYRYNSSQGIPEDIAFPSFINDCKGELKAFRPGARLAHNDVGGGYLGAVAPANTDFYYAEIWGRDHYIDIRNLILDAKAAGGRDKAVVLAAYMNYYDFGGANPPQWINEASVRLMNACVAANGAFHLELGDGDQMLTNEFFPVRRPMHDTLKRAMRDHYSFLTRYENFLFYNNQGGLRDGTDGLNISSTTHALSKNGSSGKIWTVGRIWDGEYDTVSLINLNGVDDQWRNVSADPQFQTNVQLKYYLDAKCRRILVATPDDGLGRTQDIPFTEGTDGGGYFVKLTVPSLKWWDLLIFDKSTRVKTDAWYGTPPSAIHATTVSEGEFIYRGDSDDLRSFDGVTPDTDITEVRVTADDTNVYFLIRMRDIANETIPAIGMAIDLDQDPADTGHSWIGDSSTPTGSILLENRVQYAEREVMIYHADGKPRLMLWNGGAWYDPPSGQAAVRISAQDDCVEARIPKADLGISSPQRVNLTLASFRSSGNHAGADATYDCPHNNNDAIDVMGGNAGVRDSSWNRDLSDNKIGRYASFVVEQSGIRREEEWIRPGGWKGSPPGDVHAMSFSEGEFIYRGAEGDRRNFGGATDDSDISEVRVTADAGFLYFLVRMRDITDETVPAIGMAIDTDQNPADTGYTWIGDGSTPTGSIFLENPTQYAERQVMIYYAEGGPRLKLWNGGAWYDSAGGQAKVRISALDDCIEARIPKADLGIVSPQRMKLTLASFRSSGNHAGYNSTYDTPHGNNDAIDVMGGQVGVQAGSWERDLSDNAIGSHATFLVDVARVRPVLAFAGHAKHLPVVPRALAPLTLQVETYPRAAAGSAVALWRVDGGGWQERSLDHAGETSTNGVNDLWNGGIGSFQPGSVVEYYFRASMPDGTLLIANNNGSNYSAVVPNDSDGDGLDDAWELASGLSMDSGTGDNGASGDPDRDGIVNLVEMVLGGDPRVSNSAILPKGVMEDGKFWLSFSRKSAAHATLTVEASSRPDGPWEAVARASGSAGMEALRTGIGVIQAGTGDTQQIRVGEPFDPAGATRRFLRLKVEP